jgi:superfamily II DNA or RNA helicase
MSNLRAGVQKHEETIIYADCGRSDHFGIEELNLLRPPARFWTERESVPPIWEPIDARRVTPVPTPAELLAKGPHDNWMAMTRRSLARLQAWFLLVEDPQRRLEAQPIVTLAHQASLVQHVIEQPSLRRVLLADEVGLGKTVEAGLLVKQVLEQKKGARVLYLAPARLVRNVRSEFDRLGLEFRSWVAAVDRDARLKDPLVIASIHRACHKGNLEEVLAAPPWDMIIVDECHHLSDWAASGGSATAQYKLVEQLAARLGEDGRLLLMSGTPHQGHPNRFRNLLRLLLARGESETLLAGRVIYRIKEDVRDWDDQPLFPRRQVNSPIVIDLGDDYQRWLADIHDFFEPKRGSASGRTADRRAAGWRAGQALQWAASSVQAGLGYLVRQAIRARCSPGSLSGLDDALMAIRPYREGHPDEPVGTLFTRISKEVNRQVDDADVEDIEELDDETKWRPDPARLSKLLRAGVRLLETTGDKKWDHLFERVLGPAGDEKVVLFAQPIETVIAMAAYLERRTGQRPALIIGGQDDNAREAQIAQFRNPGGPRFLVSSRAGGEGLNLQVARRLVHLDVPWNPMELEQRIGRVHRFLSRRTILVDTVVAKDSREVDTYACARDKLKTIASTLVPEERFDVLFSRVMSLVPPEEFQDILGQGPIGPLNADERARIADLVRQGFEQWKEFYDRYSKRRNEIQSLEPGDASWSDLASFASQHLGATQAEGFSALRFLWQDGEVTSAPRTAEVLSIGERLYACGDFNGMPVTRDDGTIARQLGTNLDFVTEALRTIAFPGVPAGAAHVRWPEGEARPCEGTFGVVVLVRQSIRWEQSSHVERAARLHCAVVTSSGERRVMEAHERGPLLRTLMRATVRREPGEDAAIVAAVHDVEAAMADTLRKPTDAEREARIYHAVIVLLAAVVS